MLLSEIRAAIRRQTSVSSSVGEVTDDAIDDIIREGELTVASVARWPFYDASDTLDVNIGVTEYELPEDFQLPRAVLRASQSYRLTSITLDQYLYMVGNNPSESSSATHYYITKENPTFMGFYPSPSADETEAYVIHYSREPAYMAEEGDEPEWSGMFHHMLVDYGAYRLWEREEYFDESERAYARFSRGIQDMLRYYNRRKEDWPFIFGDGHYMSNYDRRMNYGGIFYV